MGTRISQIKMQALASLERRKTEKRRGILPTELKSTPTQTTLSASGSMLSQPSQMSRGLSAAITLSGIDSDSNASQQRFFMSFPDNRATDAGQIQAIQEQVSEPHQTRAHEVTGYGNRSLFVESANEQSLDRSVNGLQTFSGYDSTESDVSAPVSQAEAQQAREAIRTYAARYVDLVPETSVEDLESAVDSTFGTGTAELFNIRLESPGGGDTTLKIDQVDISTLGQSDQEIVKAAALNGAENYESTKDLHALAGVDINSVIQNLKGLTGPLGQIAVDKLKTELDDPKGKVDEALQNFEASIAALDYDESSQVAIRQQIDQLRSTRQSIVTTYDKRPLSDDAAYTFTSGRYASAYSRAEIEEVSELTDNDIFEDR